MPRALPISEVKARLPELVVAVQEREEEIVVTRKGRPAAVLVNPDESERLRETLEILADRRLMKKIDAARAYFRRRGKGVPLDEVLPPADTGAKRRQPARSRRRR